MSSHEVGHFDRVITVGDCRHSQDNWLVLEVNPSARLLGAPAMQALLLKHPIEEAASPSDREIDANRKTVMSDHDKNLFIEQHKDGYAILRGGVKEPLAVEPTQDAAIEKARKLEPDAAIHVERVRNVEGGGRDKWRRI